VAGRCPLAAAEATPAAIEAAMAALVSPAPIFTDFRMIAYPFSVSDTTETAATSDSGALRER
jgi:precorrin isomerase